MRVSRNQRHRALWSLLFSSVGRNFSSSKTKEQWLQERGGEFSSLEGPLLLRCTQLSPTFPMAGVAFQSSLCPRAVALPCCPSARTWPLAVALPSLLCSLGQLLCSDTGQGSCWHLQRLVLGRRQDWQDFKEKNKPGLSLQGKAALSTLT